MISPASPATARRLLLLRPDAAVNGVDFASGGHDDPARLEVHFINRIGIRGTLARSRAPVTLTGDETLPGPHRAPDQRGNRLVHGHQRAAGAAPDRGYRPRPSPATSLPCTATGSIRGSSRRWSPSRSRRGAAPTAPRRQRRLCLGSEPTVTIDYLSKDFQTFCAALSDFSAARYPQWMERSEADMGVMLLEALSALADELSYQQDRVAAEATLDTATQPVSLLRHARLVDYEPAQPVAAVTTLQLDVAGRFSFSGTLHGQAADDQGQAVDFAMGLGIPGFAAADAGPQPVLDPHWNRYGDAAGSSPVLVPYLWDASRRRLRQGATSMWISGHGHGFYPGQALLLDTAGRLAATRPFGRSCRLPRRRRRPIPSKPRT